MRNMAIFFHEEVAETLLRQLSYVRLHLILHPLKRGYTMPFKIKNTILEVKGYMKGYIGTKNPSLHKKMGKTT